MSSGTIPSFPGLILGRGCDPARNAFQGDALDFEEPPDQPSESKGQYILLTLETVSNSSDLAKKLNVMTEASIGIPGFGASAEVKYIDSLQINSYSVHALVRVIVTNPQRVITKIRLKQQAKDLLNDDDGANGWKQFVKIYGTHYMAGEINGGIYYAMVEIATTSREEQENLRASLSASAVFGLAEAEGEIETTVKQIDYSKVVRVVVIQGGGAGDAIETDIESMIEQAKTFPKVALDKPVTIQAIIAPYDESLELPFRNDTESLLVRRRNDVLRELGKKYLEFKDIRADIDYIKQHFWDFEEHQVLNEADAKERLAELDEDFRGVSDQINQIVEKARVCYDSLGKCKFPKSYYVLKRPLPPIGGMNMTLKTLEEQVANLRENLDQQTQKLEALSTGIQDGSIIVGRSQLADWVKYSDEFQWTSGKSYVRMWHSRRSVAIITHVEGTWPFGSTGGRVFIGGDGYWYVGGEPIPPEPGQDEPTYVVTARCIGLPD